MKPNNNKRKDEQLGMPHGTACSRLRKSIIFHLLQKSGENICFVCKLPISSIADLSIEHKIPWQGNDTALFWDMNNIAFSHARCNRPHTRTGTPRRGIEIEGKSWCPRCKKFKDRDQFHAHKRRWNGLAFHCKECCKERNQIRYKEKGIHQGEGGKRRLTDEQAAIIKFDVLHMRQKEYADTFGISESTVSSIIKGRRYNHIARNHIPRET